MRNRQSPDWRYNPNQMNPHPAPNVPGETEAARMDAAVRKMFSVSKEDFAKEEAKYQAGQAKKKRAKKPTA